MQAVSGKASATDEEGVQRWMMGMLQKILDDRVPEDIFNINESALFFRLLPYRTLHFKGEVCTNNKHTKERISVAFG